MPQFAVAQARLDAAMEQRGEWPARAPWIREAVAARPRHAFAPDRLWRWDGAAYVPVDRAADEERWAAVVYGGPDDPAITQLASGRPSSSLSCPSVVVDMLDSLLLEEGQRVLELGAGTGWNAALLAYRAGPGRVVSIEADAGLADTARRQLAEAGAEVTVETGDGTAGSVCGAPWDRVISTYAVERVPVEWVAQTRPGGRIITPWGRLGHVALTVADDGRSASGWVQGLAQFMPARGTSAGAGAGFETVRRRVPESTEGAFKYDLERLQADWHLRFALRVALPDVLLTDHDEAVGLHDANSSWALLTPEAGGRVRQGGPRRLADEAEEAWDGWAAAGSPELYDYGLTVTPEGQYAWAHDPHTGPRWPTTAATSPVPGRTPAGRR